MIGSNSLIFANKTKEDIILESELKWMLGNSFINILSDEMAEGYAHGYITLEFLKANIPLHPGNFYLCGPPPMMEALLLQLSKLGIRENSIIMEKI